MERDQRDLGLSPRDLAKRLEDEYQAGWVTGRAQVFRELELRPRTRWIVAVVGFSAGLILGVLL